MLDETLAKLETNIRASDAIQADKKAELLRLLASLKSEIATLAHTHIEHAESVIGLAERSVLSQNSIFGQNPKIGCQEFNDLQTPKLSKKQLCDRT